MLQYLLDFSIVALLVIGITAVMGVSTNGLGESLFKRRKGSNESFDRSVRIQDGWKSVGGKNNRS